MAEVKTDQGEPRHLRDLLIETAIKEEEAGRRTDFLIYGGLYLLAVLGALLGGILGLDHAVFGIDSAGLLDSRPALIALVLAGAAITLSTTFLLHRRRRQRLELMLSQITLLRAREEDFSRLNRATQD